MSKLNDHVRLTAGAAPTQVFHLSHSQQWFLTLFSSSPTGSAHYYKTAVCYSVKMSTEIPVSY